MEIIGCALAQGLDGAKNDGDDLESAMETQALTIASTL